MGSVVKRIAISGYYGFDNSGDEAVLQAILDALAEEGARLGVRIEPVVLSINPERTAARYGVHAVHRMKLGAVVAALRSCDGLISGGGSLLQDATGVMTIPYYLGIIKLAQWLGKPTFVYAQGIGPVRRRAFNPLIRAVLKRCKYISVRDEESAGLLRGLGVGSGDESRAVEVVPDPVLGFGMQNGYASATNQDIPIIGISVRFWSQDRTELERLADVLQRIAGARAVRLLFLPFHLPSDREASQYVIDRLQGDARAMAGIAESDDGHPLTMLGEVGRCDLLMGMRLHSLIYAATQLVPMIGISYDPKIDRFMEQLQMEAIASVDTQTITHFDIQAVTQEALDLLENRQGWIIEKLPLIENLRAKSRQPAQQIVTFLR